MAVVGSRKSADEQTTPRDLIGMALSGGGIRSASFSLGAMQSIMDADQLDQFDYLSAVSGGGYIAGWMQNHLGARQQLYRDVLGYEVGTDKPSSLLNNSGDQVEQLRTHTHFIQGSSWFEGPKVFFEWLIRWPPHLLIDDILHLRGGWNFQHIIGIYRNRIEDTYFRGTPPPASTVPPKAEMPLVDSNDPKRSPLTPYMVLNANLLNRGTSQVLIPGTVDAPVESPTQWNFEFTRDFVGSDGTGYIDANGFDRPVKYVLRDAKQRPAAAVVDVASSDSSDFRLSTSVAASGAAFDSLAGVPLLSPFDVPPLTEVGQFIAGGVLNLYLGLDAPNFAPRFDGGEKWIGDINMVTWERSPRLLGTGANWLYITDGGHYENLGSLALLRRGTKCIVQFDVGADPDAEYADLRVLRYRVESDLGMRWMTALPEKGDAKGHYRFEIAEKPGDSEPTAVILYVKANANTDLPHMQPDFGSSPTARKDQLERGVKRVEDDDLVLVHRLSDTGTPAPGRRHDDLAAARESAIDATRMYYAEVVRDQEDTDSSRRQAQVAVDEAQKRVTVGEERLENMQSRQEALCRAAARICLSDEPVLPDATASDFADARKDLCDHLNERCPAMPSSAGVDPETLGSVSEIVGDLKRLDAALVRNSADLEGQRRIDETLGADLRRAREALVLAGAPSAQLQDASDARERAYERLIQRVEVASRTESAPDRSAVNQFRADVRKDNERLEHVLSEDRAWMERVEERNERIRKIHDYAVSGSAKHFPHTETILEWYDWERFEAYRLLGYQMASTYLDRLEPTADDLKWCQFAPLPPGETDAPGE